MFCKYCGISLPDDAVFCSGCGRNLAKSKQLSPVPTQPLPVTTASPNEVLFSVHQEFVALLVLGRSLFLGFILALFGFFAAVFLLGEKTYDSFHSDTTEIHVAHWAPILIIALTIFIGMAILYFISTMRAYESTVFRFYTDRIEYIAGFFTRQKKMIRYRDITEVELKQTALQRFFNIGDLVLLIPSSTSIFPPGVNSVGSGSGVSMSDIPLPEKTYEHVRALVKQSV